MVKVKALLMKRLKLNKTGHQKNAKKHAFLKNRKKHQFHFISHSNWASKHDPHLF